MGEHAFVLTYSNIFHSYMGQRQWHQGSDPHNFMENCIQVGQFGLDISPDPDSILYQVCDHNERVELVSYGNSIND